MKQTVYEKAKNIKLIQNNVPVFYKEDNAGSSRTICANRLYPGGSLGLSVTGPMIVSAYKW
mgnify:CR=1 FL=1